MVEINTKVEKIKVETNNIWNIKVENNIEMGESFIHKKKQVVKK